MRSISALEVDKAWLCGYSEQQLAGAVADLVSDTDYDRYVIVSDDVVVTPGAFEAVRACGMETAFRGAVVTGWTNPDMTDRGLRLTTVTSAPFTAHESTYEQYRWTPVRDVLAGPERRLTWFAGMCLTSMSREMWQRFPFGTFRGQGFASDFDLCWRLQQAGVPIYAVRGAGVFHVKECGNPWRPDEDPRKRLQLRAEPVVLRQYEEER